MLSIASHPVSLEARSTAYSIVRATSKETAFDTIGLYNAQVKVISAKFFNEEYSNYKSIKLTFKNVSNKRIEGIRFKWYGEDAFGDPADMDSSSIIVGFGAVLTMIHYHRERVERATGPP